MADQSYRDLLGRNIRAARVRLGINQQDLAERMRALGYDAWLHQTVGNVEKGKRRVTAEEILGLACALQVSMSALLSPAADDAAVILPSGEPLPAAHVGTMAYGRNFGAVAWDGNKPVFTDQQPRRFRVTMPTPDPGVFVADIFPGPEGESE